MPTCTESLSKCINYTLPKIRLCIVHEGAERHDTQAVQCPKDAARLLEPLRHQAEECFISLHLNAHNEVIGLHEVSRGILSASLVHPREVFKAALLANSHAILVCHNHPSGARLFATPEDIGTTDQLLKAGKVLGVSVIDHLIVSPIHEVFSLRENHPQLWE